MRRSASPTPTTPEDADTDLIAAYRSDAPALAAEVRRLRELIEAKFLPADVRQVQAVLEAMPGGHAIAALAAENHRLKMANTALVRTGEADRKDAARGYQQGEQETRTWIALQLGLGNHRFDCSACGAGVEADEDGCCASCGVDCAEHLDEVDRATIEKALATAREAAADGFRRGQEEVLTWLGGLLGWPDWNRPTRDEIKGDILDLREDEQSATLARWLCDSVGALIQEAKHHHAGRGQPLDGPGNLVPAFAQNLAAIERLTEGLAAVGPPVPQRPLLFAIDYDGTWAADPDLFDSLLRRLRGRGHKAVLVTGRGDGDQWAQEVREAIGDKLPIVFAGGTWKREAAKAAGYVVDVWIDDNPEYVAEQDPFRRPATGAVW